MSNFTLHMTTDCNFKCKPCGFLANIEKFSIGNIWDGVGIRKAKLIALSNFDKTDSKSKDCKIRDFCHGMKCGYMNFVNTGKINIPSDAECIFEHIFCEAMVLIVEYYLKQSIDILKVKMGLYIECIKVENLKLGIYGGAIAKRLEDGN